MKLRLAPSYSSLTETFFSQLKNGRQISSSDYLWDRPIRKDRSISYVFDFGTVYFSRPSVLFLGPFIFSCLTHIDGSLSLRPSTLDKILSFCFLIKYEFYFIQNNLMLLKRLPTFLTQKSSRLSFSSKIFFDPKIRNFDQKLTFSLIIL